MLTTAETSQIRFRQSPHRHGLILLASLGQLTSLICAGIAQSSADFFTQIEGDPISKNQAASAAWGDYDGDGFIDLLTVHFFTDQIHLYRNLGNGSFSNVTSAALALPAGTQITGGVWVDYDNDGRLDFYINGGVFAQVGRSFLFHNDGDGVFSRSQAGRITEDQGVNFSANWGDFDGDGWPDLFAGNWTSSTTRDALYLNQRNGTFNNGLFPGIAQVSRPSSVFASVAADLDGDGDLDVLTQTDIPTNSRLYLNDGGVRFVVRAALPPGADVDSFPWGSLGVADFDNDGDFDFLSVNASGDGGFGAFDGPSLGRNRLWRNNGDATFTRVEAGDLGTDEIIGGAGCAWGDYDNDGWLDVVVFRGIDTNGKGREVSNLLYHNNRDGTFTRLTTGSIVNENGNSRSGAWGDIDNDGDLDLVVANHGWLDSTLGNALYRNDGSSGRWLILKIEGTSSNRGAFGAKVRVKANIQGREVWQMRQVGITHGGLSSHDDLRPHFGLGDALVAEVVRIEWPSGTVQELTNVAVDQILTVVEPPRLRVEAGGQLSWPVTADGYRLESAPSLNGPWTEASELVQTNGSRKRITIQPDGEAKFYRLNGQ